MRNPVLNELEAEGYCWRHRNHRFEVIDYRGSEILAQCKYCTEQAIINRETNEVVAYATIRLWKNLSNRTPPQM